MKAPVGPPNVVPAVPSVDTERSAGAALERARSSITVAASWPAGELTVIVASMPLAAFFTSVPPAPETRALIHTTYPSYLFACTATVPPLSAAVLMSCAQVTGLFMSMPAFWTKDLRYHSTWVLDQNGATTSVPFQVAAAMALLKDCLRRVEARPAG